MDLQGVYSGFLCLIIGLILSTKNQLCKAGITSDYVRNYNSNMDMPLNSDVFRVPPGYNYNAPQQALLLSLLVYITEGDHEEKGVIVSWTTPDEPGSNAVLYWAENSDVKSSAEGFVVNYKMTQPQPRYSAHREASFGHGILDIKNRSHAHFGWHRNHDGFAVETD
ncbi:hypothetical protein RND71_027444 [Anisodus tanguticus]|uniref:Purple acid phosphatase C-terminal domain-containing protein n=1 Tax=Anisodus tanguticus TaxID=243964 RepID=A0AAE1V675_9SOLA|nr:hypothetical protein RND71_027444 [Anisodus tanguticus]